MKTGPDQTPLAERLRQKTAAEKAEIERLIASERELLMSSLRRASTDAVKTIESDIRDRLKPITGELERALQRVKLWPLWVLVICLVIILSSLALSWLVTWWHRDELAQIKVQIEQSRPVLEQMQTYGVEFLMGPDKKPVLILPLSAQTDIAPYACLEGYLNKCIWLK